MSDVKFTLEEGQLVRLYHDRNETAWAGFELVNMGGGCMAYCHTLPSGNYVLVTNNDGTYIEDMSETNFAVGLYDESVLIDGFFFDSSTTTIDDALARCGIRHVNYEDELIEEYQTYCNAHGLPQMSADELVLELSEKDSEANAEHIRWLSDFIRRWEA